LGKKCLPENLFIVEFQGRVKEKLNKPGGFLAIGLGLWWPTKKLIQDFGRIG